MILQNDQNTDPINFLRFIEVRHGKKREFLPIAKILHLDASSNYTTIHADGYQPVMVAKVLKKYQQLLEGQGFMRINNSVLINTNRVREINQDGSIVMENESIFYPSRRRKSALSSLICMVFLFIAASGFAQIGRVGINTTTPAAMLHVKDSSVVFTGSDYVPSPPPVSGPGTRMMWYPQRAAFRSGYVAGIQWDKDNTGQYSFATGSSTKASGSSSFAAGNNSDAEGFCSFAMGNGVDVTGTASFATGNFTVASGAQSFATGVNSITSGTASFASGWDTKATQQYCFAAGRGTIANSICLFAIGRYNDTSAVNSNWDDANQLFVVGNGTSNVNRKNALTILKGGNVGIGISIPHAPLQFKNANDNRKLVLSEVADNDHQFYGLGSGTDLMQYQVGSISGAHAFFAGVDETNSTELMRIQGNGNVGIGTSSPLQKLHVVGNTIISDKLGIGLNTPNAPLQFGNAVANRKIVLYESNDNDHEFYGFGINGGILRYQVPPGTSHVFYAGINSTSSDELMRIKANGNVGIDNSNPHAPLQFGNTIVPRKIVLYENADNDHEFVGFGVNTVGPNENLTYHVGIGATHKFFAATSSTTSLQLMQIASTGDLDLTGSIISESWKVPNLEGTYTNFGNGFLNAGYYLDKVGIVRLRGLVTTTTNPNNTVILTLPPGYRPPGQQSFLVMNNSGPSRVDVFANGEVKVLVGNTGIFSLDQISFRTQ